MTFVWADFESHTNYTEIAFTAWVTNSANQTLVNATITGAAPTNVPLDFSKTDVRTFNQGIIIQINNVTRSFEVLIGRIEPNETVIFSISRVGNRFSLEGEELNRGEPIYILGYTSGLNINRDARLFATTPLGRLSAASFFSHYEGPPFNVPEPRIFAASYRLLTMLTPTFILLGVLLHFFRYSSWRVYPFLTLSIIGLNAWTYGFIGSGWEINLIQELYPFKQWLPLPIAYHGSYEHITGNLPSFFLASLLLESWIKVRTNIPTFVAWYLFPLLSSMVFSYSPLYPNQLGFGLSFAIELLSISLWTRLLSGRQTFRSKKDVFLTLVSGVPLTNAFLNWVLVPVFYAPLRSPYTLQLALSHILVGALGAILAMGYLIREWRIAKGALTAE